MHRSPLNVHLNAFGRHGHSWTFSSLLSEQFGIPSQIFAGSVALKKKSIKSTQRDFLRLFERSEHVLQVCQAGALSRFIAAVTTILHSIAEFAARNTFIIAAFHFVDSTFFVLATNFDLLVAAVVAIHSAIAELLLSETFAQRTTMGRTVWYGRLRTAVRFF